MNRTATVYALGSRAVMYARYSTDNQNVHSIDDQIAACRRVARDRGLAIVDTYSDAAISGASLDRAGLDALLAACRRKPRPFDLVIVDDLSRLSRDLGAMFRIVFEEFAGAGIVLLDGMTGLRSDQPGARTMFGALGLASDAFLEQVKHEVRRALMNRAREGFATGGAPYGYRNVPEPNPADPSKPRKLITIDDVEAAIIRRIFDRYLAGDSNRTIARALNADHVPSPNGSVWRPRSVAKILGLERYAGRWSYNANHYRKQGRTKVAIGARPESEVVRMDRPDLAIVSAETFAAARARAAEAPTAPRGQPGGRYRSGPFAAFARCGICGAGLTQAGSGGPPSKPHRQLQCSTYRSAGRDVCSNGHRISERRLAEAFLATLRESLGHPSFAAAFRAGYEAGRVAEASDVDEGPAVALRREIEVGEKRRARLVDVIAAGAGDVTAIVERLRAIEGDLRALRARLAIAVRAAQPERPVELPPADPAALVDPAALAELLAGDAREAREALRARFEPLLVTPLREAGKLTAWRVETAIRVNPNGTGGQCASGPSPSAPGRAQARRAQRAGTRRSRGGAPTAPPAGRGCNPRKR